MFFGTHRFFWDRITSTWVQDPLQNLHGSRTHDLKTVHRSAQVLHLHSDPAVRRTSIRPLIIAGDRLHQRLVRLVEYRRMYTDPQVPLARIIDRITNLFPLSLSITGSPRRLRPPEDFRWTNHPRRPFAIPMQSDFCHSSTCFIPASRPCTARRAAGQYFHQFVPIARQLDC